MVRAVVLAVTVSLTLVLLPIAINVGTGGTAPRFLAPYAGWTWPLIGLLWLVAIVTALPTPCACPHCSPASPRARRS
jgi:hypothetical protein